MRMKLVSEKSLFYWLSFFIYFTAIFPCESQIPQAAFSIPSTGCLNERLKSTNTSQHASSYQWDFCEGDFAALPSAMHIGSLTGAFSPRNMDVINDGSSWLAFVVSTGTNEIYRLDFGSTMSNVSPFVTNLGNVGNLLDRPISIRIAHDNGVWLGLVVNNAGSLVRILFGASLVNISPLSETLIQGFNGNNGLAIEDTGIEKIAIATNINTNTLTIVNFGDSFLNTPMPGDLLTTTAIAGVLELDDIKILNYHGNWHGFVVGGNSKNIIRLDFGVNLFSTPIPVNVTGNLAVSGADFPTGIALQWDAGKFISFVQTFSGQLYQGDYGSDFLNQSPSYTSLGNLGLLTNSINLELIKVNSNWFGFILDFSNLGINRFTFQNPCSTNSPASMLAAPDNVTYTAAGTYHVSLVAADENGNLDYVSSSIIISNLQSPDINFSAQNMCVGSLINFIPENTSGDITSYDWDFGDSKSSTQEIASTIYSVDGDYLVNLNVISSNTCKNFAEKKIKLYNPPSPFFEIPPGLICTNNEFTFTNNTADTFDSNLTYQWFVDNNLQATSRDLKYVFSSGGNQEIKLKTSIPGCSSELTQTLLNVQTGPSVGFDLTGKCENELIRFSNTSAGNISGYLWDFGNGQTSTAVNEIQTYSSIGTYLVSLQTTAINGCVSTTSKPITIYTTPQPDFSLDLPPFSCSGTPSQFNDLTPGPTDSNLSSWSWSFGDVANGISTTKNPTYTYALGGSYNVSLTTTTNFGCAATKLKTVQISESPKPDFTLGASCLGKPTLFVDASGANNKSWLWKIGGTSYAIQNPTHIFSAPGNYAGELMVTGNNDCVSIVSKPIIVYSPPTLDFLTENNCAPQATLFKDVTITNQDPPVSHVWDFADKGSGNGSSTQFAFSSPGTYNVKLTTSTQSGCSYSLTKSTIIVAAPIADFSTSDESGPPPLAIQFKNESKNATSYQWRFNDPNSSSSSLESPSFTYTTLGDFMVDLTASNVQGCVDTKSEKIHVIVPSSEVELEQFTLLYDQVTGSVRPVLSVRNNSNYTIKNLEVILDIAGNALVKEKISLTVLPNASASQILKYELLPRNTKLDYLCVKLQLSDDRLSDETDLTDNSECISIESDEILFSPYPNPVTDQLNFDWIAEAPGSVKVSVVTQIGQLAYQKDISGIEVGLNQIVLDVSSLNSGFYMLIFETEESRKTFPFVIVN